jgi:hypothetical protein
LRKDRPELVTFLRQLASRGQRSLFLVSDLDAERAVPTEVDYAPIDRGRS